MSQTIPYHLPDELKGTILEGIMTAKLHEILGGKKKWPAEAIEIGLEIAAEPRSFKAALLRRSPAIIAEIKKASPSAGTFRSDFDVLKIAGEYQDAGAAAISVVTEAKYFRGNLETIPCLRWNMELPLLRKDFIVDTWQVLESRHAGADAVLLIAALLNPDALKELRVAVEARGMDALVEVHTEKELEAAVASGASLIGVNNRNLRTFDVSLQVCLDLAPRLPKGTVAVAESGIKSADDIRRLSDAGYRGFLIGEQLLRAQSPGGALSQLVGSARARRAS